MDEIREFFNEKNFDDKTIEYISNFVLEFDELFGKYLPKEEVLERIKSNLDSSIIWVDSFQKLGVVGRYNGEENTISLLNSIDEEKAKSIFFHEMIHCITKRNKYIGFSRKYTVDGLNYKIRTCNGVTEGFTQYLTNIRNARFNYKYETYPVLTCQVQNLIDIIGEDKFLDIAFNNPDGLLSAMIECDLIEKHDFSRMDFDQFLESFDVIWKHEEEIDPNNPVNRLLMAILGKVKTKNEIDMAQEKIINVLTDRLRKHEISTITELQKIYEEIDKYAKQLSCDNSFQKYEVFWKCLDTLQKKGISTEEILDNLSVDVSEIVKVKLEMDDFLELPTNDILTKLSSENLEEMPNIFGKKFEDDYVQKVIFSLFGNDLSNIMFYDLHYGLAKIILERGYNPKSLGIENINLDIKCGSIFYNLYHSDGKNSTYLGTFESVEEGNDRIINEYNLLPEENKKEFLEKYPKFSENSIVYKTTANKFLIFEGEDNFTFIDEFGDLYSNNGTTKYIPSRAEDLLNSINKRMKRLKTLHDLKTPDRILLDEKKGIEKLSEEYFKITRESVKNINGHNYEETTSRNALSKRINSKFDEI